jgi:hypothetical protein
VGMLLACFQLKIVFCMLARLCAIFRQVYGDGPHALPGGPGIRSLPGIMVGEQQGKHEGYMQSCNLDNQVA